jgi:hypothetical protein
MARRIRIRIAMMQIQIQESQINADPWVPGSGSRILQVYVTKSVVFHSFRSGFRSLWTSESSPKMDPFRHHRCAWTVCWMPNIRIVVPAFHFNAEPDPDPAVHFNTDPPDPAPHQSVGKLRSLGYRASTALFKPPGFYCDRPRTSTALFWASDASEFWL